VELICTLEVVVTDHDMQIYSAFQSLSYSSYHRFPFLCDM